MPDVCDSCKAVVHWALTPNGKRAPIDYEPAENGNVLLLKPNVLQGALLAVVLTGDALGAARPSAHLFLNHWATCPDKAEWRERQAAKQKRKGEADGDATRVDGQ